jgi:hypothetical protein
MNAFTSIALAGALAAAGVGATATGASADGRHHYYRPYAHNSYNPGPAIVAGTVFGLAAGVIASQAFAAPAYYPPAPVYYYPPPPPPPMQYPAYASADPHIQWCAATYNSYNVQTDTWVDFQGVARRCIAPY